MYMERMIEQLGKLGRKVDIGRKMNDPMEIQTLGLVLKNIEMAITQSIFKLGPPDFA